MTKKILMSLASIGLVTQLAASDTAQSDFYVVAKALTILGDSYAGDHVLDGDTGYGIGIDLGYRLGHGFAVEYDFSYATNTVEDDHHNTADATYFTHALDVVYTYHITSSLGVFGKLGYAYEEEEIKDFHIDGSADGAVVAGGVEYALDSHYTVLAEYEHADIEGPRGDSIFLGVMYNF